MTSGTASFETGTNEPGEFAEAAEGSPKKLVYAVFEGGGAKGITHIGGLSAILDRGYAIVGAAGASAGAIMAALVAVGYTADELFDARSRTDILYTRYGKVPTQLLGDRAWRNATLAFRMAPVGLAGIVYLLLVLGLQLSRHFSYLAVVPTLLCMVVALAPLARLLAPVMLKGGVFDTSTLRDQIERLLSDKVHQLQQAAGEPLTDFGPFVSFRHISPEVFQDACRLKIVVTDARGQTMRLFGTTETPDASVADAVVASAALPVIFRPPEIRGWKPEGSDQEEPVYVDGGLVSNLPVWAFLPEKKSLERIFDTPVPILALTLTAQTRTEDSPRNVCTWAQLFASWIYYLPFKLVEWAWRLWVPGRGFLVHAKDVVETGIFGSQTVVQDLVSDIRVIEMSSPLETTQFGCTRDEAIAAYVAGRNAALVNLDTLETTALAERQLLDELLRRVKARLARMRARQGRPPKPNLRAHLVDCPHNRDPRIALSVGGDPATDADDRLEFGEGNSAVTKAYVEGLITVAAYDGKPGAIQDGMSKYEKAQLRSDRKSIVSIPVFDVSGGKNLATQVSRRTVVRVVCIDSDDDLQQDIDDTRFSNWLVRETMVFQPR